MSYKSESLTRIKSSNRSDVFNLLYSGNSFTKQEIAYKLYLSLPTVTANLSYLLDLGIICKSGYKDHTGGRRAITYSLNSNFRVAIGLDITKNHITTVVVNLRGDVLHRETVKYLYERTDAYFRYLGQLVDECVNASGVSESSILGVGIGVPGLVDESSETIRYGKTMNFTGVTREEFSRYIRFPTFMINDAKAAAGAEFWTHPELNTFFYVMLSDYVGGALIIDGHLYGGYATHSAEIGHICLEPNGKQCYCGNRGCSDPYLSATALSQFTDGNFEVFFELLEHRNPTVLKAFDTYLEYLCRAATNAYVLLECPIVLGGYVGSHLEPYIGEIQKRVARMNQYDPGTFIRTCRYKTEPIAAGSALYFISNYISSF